MHLMVKFIGHFENLKWHTLLLSKNLHLTGYLQILNTILNSAIKLHIWMNF